MQDFPPAHHPCWRPCSHDTKPPCILRFYCWKLSALLSRPPISILLPLCSTLPSNAHIFTHTSLIQMHSYFCYKFLQSKICTCNLDWTQFNQHIPLDPDIFRHTGVFRSWNSPQGPWPILAIVCISPSSILIIFPSAVPVNRISAKATCVIRVITKPHW